VIPLLLQSPMAHLLAEAEPAAEILVMQRRLRWLNELSERIALCASADECLACFCEAVQGELSAQPASVWRGELPLDEADEGMSKAAAEARRDGRLRVHVGVGEPRPVFTLLVPIQARKPPADLIVFRRSERFSENEQTIVALAASFVGVSLRAHLVLSELKESQAQLHQSDRIKSIGQLAGGVAHDFNNMLMVISAAAEVTSDMLSNNKPSSVRSAGAAPAAALDHPCLGHLELIINTSHRAAELTRKLLTFSRKGRLAMQVVDIHDVLASVREFLVHSLDRRIALRLVLGGSSCLVQADSTQLQNALLNICLNARDAMPGGGTLELSTQRVDLDRAAVTESFPGLAPGPYVRIDVRDSGTGMDGPTLDRAFEPFFTTKEPSRGTGLGLSVVFGTIREHGGSIALSSEPGKGTTCTILLPLIEAGRIHASESPPVARRNPSLRILLLDDEPGVCRTTAQLLRQLGHNVQALRDGDKAKTHLLTHAGGYDLLILDVMMPHPTGVEVHRALRGEGIVVPTVFVSGYSEQHLLEGIVEGDGIVFLQKPFRQSDLSDAILRSVAAAESIPSAESVSSPANAEPSAS
jgi:signal transduction histidine kinase/ActR/RegA family two-component response regulator